MKQEEQIGQGAFRQLKDREIKKIWKKGPAAYDVGRRCWWIVEILNSHPRRYLSSRQACRILEISRHTLDLWRRLGLIERHPMSKKFATDHLRDFTKAMSDYGMRTSEIPRREDRMGPRKEPFEVLMKAKFRWSRTEKQLSPSELARRIGCHVSTIYRGIEKKAIPAKRRTEQRWVIPRNAWLRMFRESVIVD